MPVGGRNDGPLGEAQARGEAGIVWPSLIPLALAALALIAGVRYVLKDAEDRRWGWAAMGCISTIAGILALLMIANIYALGVAGL